MGDGGCLLFNKVRVCVCEHSTGGDTISPVSALFWRLVCVCAREKVAEVCNFHSFRTLHEVTPWVSVG